eukprot:34140-Eustigmatos_ZCMA.PRE.1
MDRTLSGKEKGAEQRPQAHMRVEIQKHDTHRESQINVDTSCTSSMPFTEYDNVCVMCACACV